MLGPLKDNVEMEYSSQIPKHVTMETSEMEMDATNSAKSKHILLVFQLLGRFHHALAHLLCQFVEIVNSKMGKSVKMETVEVEMDAHQDARLKQDMSVLKLVIYVKSFVAMDRKVALNNVMIGI